MTSLLDPQNTIVIADFDGTLTKKYVNGKFIPSQGSILEHDPKYVGPDGGAILSQLFAKYHPIETDPTYPQKEREQLMYEWWNKCFQFYKDHHISKHMITEICDSPFLQLRDGLLEFLQFLNAHNIPLIIYSASGIGTEGITALLKKYSVDMTNIKLCSNTLLFDEHGVFTHVMPPIITSANKTGEMLKKLEIIPTNNTRQQCLLVGDGIGDVRMIEGLDFNSIYKVAFCNDHAQEFIDRFDMLLPNDSGYHPILDLFK